MWPLSVIILFFFLVVILPILIGFGKARDSQKKEENFFQRLPYRSLSTRHYKKYWQTKTRPKCLLTGKCNSTPGYYLNYHQFLEYPNRLQNFYFGHSQYGDRYQDLDAQQTPPQSSRKYHDLRNPEYPDDYPSWYDYQPRSWKTWHSNYIGHPWSYY